MFESLSLFSFLIIGFGLLIAGFNGWDQRVGAFVQRAAKRRHDVTMTAQFFSWTPFSVFMLFLLPFFLWWKPGSKIEAIALLSSCAIAVVAAFVVKFVFRRTRPGGLITHYGELDSSFPSAHTAGPFAAAIIIADVLPSVAFFALAFAAAVAASRVWLGLHFTSDLGGGLVLAYVSAWIVTQNELLAVAISFFGI